MAISSCSCAEKMELGACGCSCQRCCAISGVSMRRPNIIIGILAVVVCGVLLAVAFWPEKEMPEPVYKGKKLSEWLEQSAAQVALPMRFPTGTPRGKNFTQAFFPGQGSTEALDRIGTNAIPCYLHWISYEPSLLQKMKTYLTAKGWLKAGVATREE